MEEIKLELDNAMATMEMPQLVIEGEEKEEVAEKENSLEKFSEEEQKQIKDVADKIDITNSNLVLSYGASAQTKVSEFADGALQSVRGKDMGETGQALSTLLVELKTGADPKK